MSNLSLCTSRRTLRRGWLAVLLALLMLGCDVAPEGRDDVPIESVASHQDHIYFGTAVNQPLVRRIDIYADGNATGKPLRSCTGSAIADGWMLTSADCVYSAANTPDAIRLYGTSGRVFKRVYVHPTFQGYGGYDQISTALLAMSDPRYFINQAQDSVARCYRSDAPSDGYLLMDIEARTFPQMNGRQMSCRGFGAIDSLYPYNRVIETTLHEGNFTIDVSTMHDDRLYVPRVYTGSALARGDEGAPCFLREALDAQAPKVIAIGGPLGRGLTTSYVFRDWVYSVIPANQRRIRDVCQSPAELPSFGLAPTLPLPPAGVELNLSGSTASATADGPEVRYYGDTSMDVFYGIEVTRNELFYVDTFGSSFDTLIYLAVVDSSSGQISYIHSISDNACTSFGGAGGSRLAAHLTPGKYLLGVRGETPTASGTYKLRVQHLPGSYPVALIDRDEQGASFVMNYSIDTTYAGNNSQSACGGWSGNDAMAILLSCPAHAAAQLRATTILSSSGSAYPDTVLSFRSGSASPRELREPSNTCDDDSRHLQPALLSDLTVVVPGGAGLHAIYLDGYQSGGLAMNLQLAMNPAANLHVDTSAALSTLPAHGGPGGLPYSLDCGAHAVMVGVAGETREEFTVGGITYSSEDNIVYRLGPVCANLESDGSIGGVKTSPMIVGRDRVTTDGEWNGFYSEGTGGIYHQLCPEGQAVVGIHGAAGKYLDRFGIICAPAIEVASRLSPYNSANDLTRMTDPVTIDSRGGPGGSYFYDICPGNRFVRGINVQAGSAVDKVQAYCSQVGMS